MIVPLLRTTDPAYQRRLQQLLTRGESASAEVETRVREILQQVKKTGDRALCTYTKQFDHVQLAPDF